QHPSRDCVAVVSKALSSNSGSSMFYVPHPGAGSSSLHAEGPEASKNFQQEQVELVTMDQYCTQQGIAELIMLKCDAEGHDLYVMEGAREMIRSERPVGIVMTYETGAYARATILAAQETGIPTIGIQHGFISPDSAEYMFRRASQASSKDGCPIPIRTAVAGSYTSQILTQLSSYPKNSVIITGYPRHDDFAALLKNGPSLSRESLLRDIGLKVEKKTVMIASGGFHSKYGWDDEYDKQILGSMLKLASGREDLQLIIRLHPMEDGKMQTALVQSFPTVIVATVKGERHDLVWVSDLFVTVNSSTAIDALIFRKPVFILDVTGEGIPTIDLGEAAVKFKIPSLAQQVSVLLSDPSAIQQLERHIDAELERHANTVDGRASARVYELIAELVRRPEK
ncbi:MAG: FkbM family methyltransferase, partial [Candidatus Bathyarchaeia archaeon]